MYVQHISRMICVIVSCIFLAQLQAQDLADYRYVEIEQGLANRQVNAVLRDQMGFFIVFSSNNIQQWDGAQFKDIQFPSGQRLWSFDRNLKSIEQLSDGRIVLLPPQDGADIFYLLPGQTQLEVLKKPDKKGSFLATDKCLWFIDKQNTFKLQGEEWKQINMPPLIEHTVQLISHGNSYLLQDKAQNIYQSNGQQWDKLEAKGQLIKNSNGRIFLASDTQLYRFKNNQFQAIARFANSDHKNVWVKKDASGNILIGRSALVRKIEDIAVYDWEGSVKYLNRILEDNMALLDISSHNFLDKAFVASHNGIYIYSFQPEVFNIAISNKNAGKSEFGSVITGMQEMEDGNLFVLRETKRFYHYDPVSKKITEPMLAEQAKGFLMNNQKTHRAPDGTYWTFSFKYADSSDLFAFKKIPGVIQHHLVDIKLSDFYPSADGKIILGGYRGAQGYLKIYDPTTKTSKDLSTIDEIRRSVVMSISFDEVRKIFLVGTQTGLLIFDAHFKLIDQYNSRQQGAKFLESEYIRFSKAYEKYHIIGTEQGGIAVLDLDKGSIARTVGIPEGLSQNTAISMEIDDQKNIWIGTFNGLNVLNKEFEVIRKFYDHEGLPNREFNTQASHRSADGRFYFGTVNGMLSFYPEKALSIQPSAGVAIKNVIGYVNGKPTPLEFSAPSKYHAFSQHDSIEVQLSYPDFYNHYNTSLPPDFIKISSDQPLAHNWDGQTLWLKNIKKGETNISLSTNGGQASNKFQIVSKYNLRPIGIWLSIISGVIAIIYLINRFQRRQHKQKEEGRIELNKRIAQLELSALQAQMNPHFIFNALGSVQYFIQTQETEKAEEYLSNFAHLMRLILESSKSKTIPLGEEIRLLELYMGLEKLRFEQKFNYRIEVMPGVSKIMEIPPMIIQPIIENAINHGLYHLTNRKGDLLLRIEEYKTDGLKIVVQDNGIGRTAARKLKRKNHKSRGTQILQDRIQTLNDSAFLNVQLQTEDLFHQNNPIGTRVNIFFEFQED